MFKGGDGNAHRVMCAAPATDKVWDQVNKSGFVIDTENTKLEGIKGVMAFYRPLKYSAGGKNMDLAEGLSYNFGVSWGVFG